MAADFVLSRHVGKEVLLVRKKESQYGAPWALPGGFRETVSQKGHPWTAGKETSLEAALRELQEETGADLWPRKEDAMYVGRFSKRNRDPRNSQNAWVLSDVWRLDVGDDVPLLDGEEKCEWHPIDDLKEQDMAFDHWQVLRRSGLVS